MVNEYLMYEYEPEEMYVSDSSSLGGWSWSETSRHQIYEDEESSHLSIDHVQNPATNYCFGRMCLASISKLLAYQHCMIRILMRRRFMEMPSLKRTVIYWMINMKSIHILRM